ncbi:MAG: radical SAM-associated putative lipoprotein [Paludibacteraceae bacterium]|nr:radical SAM-associated putative lipoprotein [Paludibacteraceae bacterium]
MKSTKLLTGLLALLGFQMQSCRILGDEPDEYGCPYTTYKTSGSVKDTDGRTIEGADVNVKIAGILTPKDSLAEKPDTLWHTEGKSVSNRKGLYETKQGGERGYRFEEAIHVEIITNKNGYESDTIRKEMKEKDFRRESGKTWETILSQVVNVVLKKK